MATVHVVLSTVHGRALTGSTMPVPDSVPLSAETLTSGANPAQGSLTGVPGQFWSVTVSGGNVFVAFGSSPDAGAGKRWLLVDGDARDFAVTIAGEKLAHKDA